VEHGSAYLEVSNLEKTLRTRWTVRVTLHPGRAYLDEQIRIFNPVDAVNPYYFWNCTAFPCHAGTRFIYPMTLGTDHNGVEFFTWPVHEGNDLSWLKNYETWASIFAVDCVFDFFGAYDVRADRGVVQVANHYELSGKKAWTWGQWDFGLVSQKNLTDEDGPYIEVQSGPLPTQSDYGMLLPRQEVAWREWWYPVHGLGEGFEFATKDLAVQAIRKKGILDLRLLATGRFSGASCSVSRDGKELLAPSFVTPLPIPDVSPPPRSQVLTKPDEQLTLQETYLKARKHDLATNRKKARHYYEKVLAADSGHAAALRGLAVLDIEAGLYDEAAERLDRALRRDPDDGPAWYFLGVTHLRTDNAEEALRCARQAARYAETGSLALDLAGRAHAALGEYRAALAAFEKATQSNPRDGKARDHYLLALYAAGDKRVAFRTARRTGLRYPTDLVPRALLALRSEKDMRRFVKEVRGFVGEDDFEMLETSLVFGELGLWREAEQVLVAACVDAVPAGQRSPLPLYYLAYFASRRDDTAAARDYLRRAAATCRDYVFPSRPEALKVFAYALRMNPDDARAHLHLGNLYAHLGRVTEAAGHWRIEARPKDQTLYRDLAEVLLAQKRRPEAIKVLESTPFEKLRRADIIIVLAQAYFDEQRYTDAIDLLESTPYFVNWEGQTVTWDLFHKSHIQRGRQRFDDKNFKGALQDFEAALTYPENIGVGRSNKPQEAAAEYWRGRALQALGRESEAKSAWRRGADGAEGSAEQNKHRELCREALSETE